MIVMKFGGTSVQDASALRKVAAIIDAHGSEEGGVLVVLSATAKTTNALLDLARRAVNGIDAVRTDASALITRHENIVHELIDDISHRDEALQAVRSLGSDLVRYLDGIAILNECTDQSLDMVASFGERLSTTLFAIALSSMGRSSTFFDARSVMRTNDAATCAAVDMSETKRLCEANLRPLIQTGTVVVTQGFIGSTIDGVTTTLGRGGSDASAAIFGAALRTREIQIWTDVSGVYNADPRIIPDARPVPSMSFGEMRELALYGAKVLHPDAIKPAIDEGIPVRVLNTFSPNDEGTVITADRVEHGPLHAVSIVRSCIMISGDEAMLDQIRSREKIKQRILLESHSLEHSLLMLHAPDDAARTEIDVACAGTTAQVREAAIVVATGPSAQEPATLQRIGTALDGLNIHAVLSGMSPWAFFVIVPDEESVDVIRRIHGSAF
jgi:aspartate kinase